MVNNQNCATAEPNLWNDSMLSCPYWIKQKQKNDGSSIVSKYSCTRNVVAMALIFVSWILIFLQFYLSLNTKH